MSAGARTTKSVELSEWLVEANLQRRMRLELAVRAQLRRCQWTTRGPNLMPAPGRRCGHECCDLILMFSRLERRNGLSDERRTIRLRNSDDLESTGKYKYRDLWPHLHERRKDSNPRVFRADCETLHRSRRKPKNG